MKSSPERVAREYCATEQSAIGFEVAVADYENIWSAYQAAQIFAETAETEMNTAKAVMDESIDQLDAIAVAFNDASPKISVFDELLYQLDGARDHMIAATDEYEAASARYQLASEQYNSIVRTVEESFDVVRSLRTQLDRSVYAGVEAANDAEYELNESLDTLSDNARYMYQQAA